MAGFFSQFSSCFTDRCTLHHRAGLSRVLTAYNASSGEAVLCGVVSRIYRLFELSEAPQFAVQLIRTATNAYIPCSSNSVHRLKDNRTVGSTLQALPTDGVHELASSLLIGDIQQPHACLAFFC